MNAWGLWVGIWFIMCLSSQWSVAQETTVEVAVAANFSAPMQEIAQVFQKSTGIRVLYAIGATGQFYEQIEHGAPFQILLAADRKTPLKLVAEHQAVEGSVWTYAVGKLVLWSADPQLVDKNANILKTGAFDHLAIANPVTAPYGAAALEVLHRMGLYDVLATKLVRGNSIGQTWQFVRSGNASLGFVALSQVLRIHSGSMWLVPSTLYTPLAQDAVLLTPGAHSAPALAFMQYLHGAVVQEIIRSYGYGL